MKNLLIALLFAAITCNALAASSKGGGFSGGKSSKSWSSPKVSSSSASRSSSWSKPSASKSSSASKASSWATAPKKTSSWSAPAKPATVSKPSTTSSGGWSAPKKSAAPSTGPPKSSGWSAPKTASSEARSKSWGVPATTTSQKPKLSSADRALGEKAKANGTAFQTRDEAATNFKQKYSHTYTSQYKAEPTNRPTHIPKATTINNSTYNIVYERQHGGYGYYSSGRWYAYDAFTDGYILASLMNRHSYHYPRNTTVYTDNDVTVVTNDGSSWGGIFLGILIGLSVLVIVGFVVARE